MEGKRNPDEKLSDDECIRDLLLSLFHLSSSAKSAYILFMKPGFCQLFPQQNSAVCSHYVLTKKKTISEMNWTAWVMAAVL